jgi:DNA-binding NarL/FixJ family response regulator
MGNYTRIPGAFICDECTTRTSHIFTPKHAAGCKNRVGELTQREGQIAILLSQGKTVKDIATALNLSTKTIEAHRQNIYRSLGIHNIASLVRWVILYGGDTCM